MCRAFNQRAELLPKLARQDKTKQSRKKIRGKRGKRENTGNNGVGGEMKTTEKRQKTKKRYSTKK